MNPSSTSLPRFPVNDYPPGAVVYMVATRDIILAGLVSSVQYKRGDPYPTLWVSGIRRTIGGDLVQATSEETIEVNTSQVCISHEDAEQEANWRYRDGRA